MGDSITVRYDSLINMANEKKYWAYDYSFLAGAIGKLSGLTGDKKYYNYMKDYVDGFINEDVSINYYNRDEYNLDLIRPGVNLFTLYHKTNQEKYNTAIHSLIEQLKTHPRTKDGGFWHKQIYPYQMWLDGIFMVCPFMAEYTYDYSEPQWYDEIVKQIKQI